MLALFCLRLAAGLMASLLLLPAAQVNPRFYRVHFQTALALALGAVVLFYPSADGRLWLALGGAATALLGSLVWAFEGAPGGRVLLALTTLLLTAALGLAGLAHAPEMPPGEVLTNEL